MMTNTSTVEVQFTNLTKAIKGLTKYLQDQDNQIVKLTDRVKNVMDGVSSHAPGKHPMVQEKKESSTKQTHVDELQVFVEGGILINPPKDFTLGTIKDKYDVSLKSSFTYTKPYTLRIDVLKIPLGYQLPKF